MSWQQVSNRRWERSMDGLEGYFAIIARVSADIADGREHYTLFSKLKMEADIPGLESALRHAWKQIRYEQPQIATTVEDMKKVYEVPNDKTLDEWLASTFIISQAFDFEELYRTVSPIKQATLYYLPNSSELVFRGHHHTIDGTGVLLFWHSYLEALVTPLKDVTFGDETRRLAPTMDKVLGYPDEPAQDVQENVTKMFGDYAESFPGIGPVSQIGRAPPGACQNAEITFSAETTGRLVRACKTMGVSVTAAVQAAYVQAMMRHADLESNTSQYVTANSFDLRKYLPEPYGSSKYAVSVYYSPLPYIVDLPSPYWEIAKSLHGYYQTSFKGKSGALQVRGPLGDAMCGAAQSPEFLAMPPSRDALISSLGVAENHLHRGYGRSIKVHDFKLGVDVTVGMSMLFIYTFQDQLRLTYCFNNGFEKPSDIQQYLNTVEEVLARQLLT